MKNTTADMLPPLLEWLDGHINYERTGMGVPGDPAHDPERRLRHMHRFMELMDEPQNLYPSIHVTGTNGKTSTARMITSLVTAQGLRAGTMTSPHLERINERISINGDPIPDDDLADLLIALRLLETMMGDDVPSYFEIMTAAGFRYFADAPVEVGVIEVGVGGTFDATNVIDASVAVVTNVGLDHMNYLGTTREEIAVHKAGIIKPVSTLILAEPEETLHPIFLDRGPAASFVTGHDFAAEDSRVAVGGRVVNLRTPRGVYEDVFIALHGQHQATNAATALMAVEALFDLTLHEDVVRAAFESVRSPGRLEVVSRRPLCVLDGAHNAAGADSLVAALDEEFAVDGSRIFVIGMLSPHDPEEMLRSLRADKARLVVACQPDSPRGVPAADIAAAAKALGIPVVTVADPTKATQEAMASAGEDDIVVVTGSLYAVGAARSVLV